MSQLVFLGWYHSASQRVERSFVRNMASAERIESATRFKADRKVFHGLLRGCWPSFACRDHSAAERVETRRSAVELPFRWNHSTPERIKSTLSRRPFLP